MVESNKDAWKSDSQKNEQNPSNKHGLQMPKHIPTSKNLQPNRVLLPLEQLPDVNAFIYQDYNNMTARIHSCQSKFMACLR